MPRLARAAGWRLAAEAAVREPFVDFGRFAGFMAVAFTVRFFRRCSPLRVHTRSADRDSFAWIDSANLKSHWEIKITDTAHQLADDCLDHDDTGRAIRAAEAGLRAMPTHTLCTEALMRAHAANGNLAAVQHVFQEHVTALELIHLDQPAPSTTDLYQRLMDTS